MPFGLALNFLNRLGEGIGVLRVAHLLRYFKKLEDSLVQVARMAIPVSDDHLFNNDHESLCFSRAIHHFTTNRFLAY